MVPDLPVHAFASAHRRRRVIRAFRKVEAIAPGGARPIADLAIKDDRALQWLRKREVVRALPDGRIYLDEDRLREMGARRARIGLSIAFVVFLIVVVVMALRA